MHQTLRLRRIAFAFCEGNLDFPKNRIRRISFVFREGILNFKKPESCFRIDDNFIQASIKKLNIEVIPVSYNGDISWTCSFDMNKSNTHPEWSELRSDHRPPMIQKCVNDFNKLNKI